MTVDSTDSTVDSAPVGPWLSNTSVCTVDSAAVSHSTVCAPLSVPPVCTLCAQPRPSTVWLPVSSVCTVGSAPVCPCRTGCLCPLYVELTMPQCPSLCVPLVCLVVRQLYIQSAQTTSHKGAHWGTVYCTYREGWGRGDERRGWAQRAQPTKQ